MGSSRSNFLKGGVFPGACLALLAWTAPTVPVLARIEVNVTRIGFPSMDGEDVVRGSAWAPVVVDLALVDQPAFDGWVRVAQFDNDGDEAYDLVEVHLGAETGGTRRVVLYSLPNFLQGQGKFHVEVQSLGGEAEEVVCQGELTRRPRPVRQPSAIPDDDLLILSVSNGALGRLNDLIAPEHRETYARAVHIAHISPGELPDHWIGLEAVDYILWEAASPNDLTEKQIQALIDWVRHGGMLLIMSAPGDASFGLRKSLNGILPVDIGSLYTVDALDNVYEQLLSQQGEYDPPRYVPPVPVVRCKARGDAVVLAREESEGSDLIARRGEGLGSVVFAGITEKNLFRGSARPIEFYRNVFLLGREDQPSEVESVTLFHGVISAVSFLTSGGLYLSVAALFSIGYVLLTTFGLWSFLTSRGWRHHSWSAFALMALLASAVSVFAVHSLRGFGERLHQISIIDTMAGEPYGRAMVFFGFKTPADRSLDLWLPSDAVAESEPTAGPCFLRPVPTGPDFREASGSFADPQEYRLVPGSAAIEDVRVRGTLKQFEGRWEGRLGGKLAAQITVRQEPGGSTLDWRMTQDSYVVNELGVTLENCYLLQPLYDIHAPLERNRGFQKDLRRHEFMYAFRIGDLPKDAGRIFLAPRCYVPSEGQEEFRPVLDWQLKHAHNLWVLPFRGALESVTWTGEEDSKMILGNEYSALLLLSTLGEFDPVQYATKRGMVAGFMPGGMRTWSRDRLRRLDLREKLERDSVYLMGFAREPGPIRLCRRQGSRAYSSVEPEPGNSWTVYRIRIPVTLIPDPNKPKVGTEPSNG